MILNTIKIKTASNSFHHIISILLILLAFSILVYGVYTYLPGERDWHVDFRPAALEMLALRTPYSVPTFYNPPWALIPLLPLALLPAHLGYSILFVLGMFGFSYLAHRLGAKLLILIFVILSYPLLFSLVHGQIEWLVLIGLILPPQIGLFFILIKPQIGAVIALFWLVEAWRNGGFILVFKTFLPVSIAFLLSFSIFGFWFFNVENVSSWQWNASLWPQSIPFGVAILYIAIRTRNIRLAMIASPLLSPYVGPHSWSIALLGLLPMSVEVVLVSLATWVVRFMAGNQFMN
jgi:hypothetical protein